MNRLLRQSSQHALVFSPNSIIFSRIACCNYSDLSAQGDLEPEPARKTVEPNPEKFVTVKNAPRLAAGAKLGPPTQVACYSRLAPFSIRYNENSSLRRFIEPPPNANLYAGSNSFFGRDPEVMRLLHRPMCVDPAVRACLEGKTSARQALLEADVVITKDAMVAILSGAGSFNASYIDGKLYLEEHDERKPGRATSAAGYGAYGFKRVCTKLYYPAPKEFPPNGFNDWVAVVSRTLGGLNLVVAGTVSCVTGKYTGRPECYLDLRSSARSLLQGSIKSWKSWYLNAHLLGTPAVYAGYRNGNVLERTELIRTNQLPELINKHEDGKKLWNPEGNIDWCFRVLYMLRLHCQEAIDERELRNHLYKDNVVWRVVLRGRKGDGMYIRHLRAGEILSELSGWADIPDRAALRRRGILDLRLVQSLDQLRRDS